MNVLLYVLLVFSPIACTKNELGKMEICQTYMEKIKDLSSTEQSVVDAATVDIFNSGRDAIPYLIENASNNKKFFGGEIFNPQSSQIQQEVTVGVASLYIAEAIIRSDIHFALNPLLLSKKHEQKDLSKNEPRNINIAIQAYKEWLVQYGKIPLKDIRTKMLYPLSNSDVYWYGASGR